MKPRVGISLGDPLGIGPEVVAKALAEPELSLQIEPVIFGDAGLLAAPYRASCDEEESARQAYGALQQAVDALLAGEIHALATAPLHKAALAHAPGGPFMGHTGYLAYRSHGAAVMAFVARQLRVALLTVHAPIGEVPSLLRSMGVGGIVRRVVIFARGLQQDLAVARPRIALLGLNPHAGEQLMLGTEEREFLLPAVKELQRSGVDVQGPLPADGAFAQIGRGDAGFDGVVACYHDQGLVGFKALAPTDGVQVTLGLPVVRTSCQHGTARDIAGAQRADPRSMRQAMLLAGEIALRRGIA